MPKSALIYSLLHYCTLVIIFWAIFELSLVVNCDCFKPLVFGFYVKDILERLNGSQLWLQWLLILSLGFCLIVFFLVHLGVSYFPLFDSRIKEILDQFINYYYYYLLYWLFSIFDCIWLTFWFSNFISLNFNFFVRCISMCFFPYYMIFFLF